MFCPNCGTPVPDGSSFCVNCGKRLASEPVNNTIPVQQEAVQSEEVKPEVQVQPETQYQYQAQSAPEPVPFCTSTEAEDCEEFTAGQQKAVIRFMCIICYLNVYFLIPFFMFRNKKYVRSHVNNGLLLLIFSAGCSLIPFIGWAAEIFLLVISIIGIVHAAKGQPYKLPIIGGIKIIK